MVSALQGSGGYASHCKGSKVLHYVDRHKDNEYECSICRKTLILEKHWYGNKLRTLNDFPCLATIYCNTDKPCFKKRMKGWELCKKHFGEWLAWS